MAKKHYQNNRNMKRSIKSVFVFMLSALMLVGMNAYAQNEEVNESRSVSVSTTEDGKVKLKVTTKTGTDTQTFEKTYDSHEDMKNDPELGDYGISMDDFSFGGSGFRFGSPNSTFSFHRMPGMSFGNDDDDNHFSHSFSFGLDSLMDNLTSFGLGSPFSFRYGPGGKIDVDSLVQKFDFDQDGGKFFMNGEEFMDMDALREKLKEQFDNLDFDFDFGDWEDRGNDSNIFFFGNDDGDDDHGRVISRARVFIRTARDSDKEAVGANEMKDLQINDISFYPNPSDGRFNVELETGNGEPVQIKIIDPAGAVVYDKRDANAEGKYDFKVDISGHEKGIYILQVIQSNSALTKRIIIE